MVRQRPSVGTGPLMVGASAGGPGRRIAGYVAAVAGVALVSVLIALIPGADRVANVSLVYLAVVIVCGLRFGSGPAVLASLLAFLVFDFCFVMPVRTFTVADPAEWLALLMFLLTATAMGHLTAQLRLRADEARRRELETIALAQVSWTIAAQTWTGPALQAVLKPLIDLVGASAAAVAVRSGGGRIELMAAAGARAFDPADPALLRAIGYVLDHGMPIASERDRHLWDKALASPQQTDLVYLPLAVEHRRLGVLTLRVPSERMGSANVRRIIDTLANHAAVILERDRLVELETRAKVLAETDRLKTALLSMVSHDFRSPLASIKASAASVLSAGASLDEPVRRELLEGIVQSTDRLDRMVGNILALSQLEADAWRPQTELIVVAEVVEAGLAAFSAADNRRVAVEMAEPMLEAQLDPVQIARVIHNLVENALKYSPADQPVEVAVGRSGSDLLITVADRGPGIALGDESRIFTRFYRAPNLAESAVPGLGIGLAICKGLVEAHHGTLTASPREGGGTCFRVTLPLAGLQQEMQA